MGLFSTCTLVVCVLVSVGIFAATQALDFCPRAENDCQSPVKMFVHKQVEFRSDRSGGSDLLQNITQLNVSCKNLMGKTNFTYRIYKGKMSYLVLIVFSFLQRGSL